MRQIWILFLMFLLICGVFGLCVRQAHSKEILISFDGSDYLDRWEDTLDFAKENHVKFTYFVSAPYFVTELQESVHPYWALHELKQDCLIMPRENIQFEQINKRMEYLKRALEEGHELGSHFVGHYDGSKWTYEQWMKEMAYFKEVMQRSFPSETASGELKYVCPMKWIIGARAPYLGTSEAYFKALKDSGYAYDSSTGSIHTPAYVNSGVTETVKEIPIVKMKVIAPGYVGPEGQLPFDCDYITKVQYKLFPDTGVWEKNRPCTDQHILDEEKKAEDIFFNSLCYDYLNKEGPTQICLHFQHRVGEPYINAMKRFVLWAKDKNPEYLTYKDYYVKQGSKETIQAIEKHDANLPMWKDPGQ